MLCLGVLTAVEYPDSGIRSSESNEDAAAERATLRIDAERPFVTRNTGLKIENVSGVNCGIPAQPKDCSYKALEAEIEWGGAGVGWGQTSEEAG